MLVYWYLREIRNSALTVSLNIADPSQHGLGELSFFLVWKVWRCDTNAHEFESYVSPDFDLDVSRRRRVTSDIVLSS